MKNIFTFKMIKVAGIVMSVVLGLGAMAPAYAVDLESLAAARANILATEATADPADVAAQEALAFTNDALRNTIADGDAAIGTFASVAATAGTPAEAEILASITGTYTNASNVDSIFIITLAANGIWYEDGSPREESTVEGLLDGSITYNGAITNVTGSLVYVAPVAAIAATEGTFTGDGLLGDVADAITAEQAARMMADASIRVEFASADTALIAAQALINTAIRGEFATADTDAALLSSNARDAIQSDVDANEAGSLTARNTIQSDVDQNEADALTARGVIQSDVDSNETASDLADSSATTDRSAIRSELATAKFDLAALITAEAALRTSGDTGLTSSLNTEISDRQSEITRLEGLISTATSGGSSDVAAVQSDVDANEADSDTAIAAVQTDVDANADTIGSAAVEAVAAVAYVAPVAAVAYVAPVAAVTYVAPVAAVTYVAPVAAIAEVLAVAAVEAVAAIDAVAFVAGTYINTGELFTENSDGTWTGDAGNYVSAADALAAIALGVQNYVPGTAEVLAVAAVEAAAAVAYVAPVAEVLEVQAVAEILEVLAVAEILEVLAVAEVLEVLEVLEILAVAATGIFANAADILVNAGLISDNATAITAEETRAISAEDALSGRITSNDTDIATNVSDINALEAIDNFTQAEFGSFNTSNTTAITDGDTATLTSAKNYADTNDADTQLSASEVNDIITEAAITALGFSTTDNNTQLSVTEVNDAIAAATITALGFSTTDNNTQLSVTEVNDAIAAATITALGFSTTDNDTQLTNGQVNSAIIAATITGLGFVSENTQLSVTEVNDAIAAATITALGFSTTDNDTQLSATQVNDAITAAAITALGFSTTDNNTQLSATQVNDVITEAAIAALGFSTTDNDTQLSASEVNTFITEAAITALGFSTTDADTFVTINNQGVVTDADGTSGVNLVTAGESSASILVETNARIADVNAIIGNISVTDAGVVSGAGDLKALIDQLVAHAVAKALAVNNRVDTNVTNIATNVTNIATNASDIATNTTAIDTNANAIGNDGSVVVVGQPPVTPFGLLGDVKDIKDARAANDLVVASPGATTAAGNLVTLLGNGQLSNTQRDLRIVSADNTSRLDSLDTSDYRLKQVWTGSEWVNAGPSVDADGNIVAGMYTAETAAAAGQVVWRYRTDIEGFTPNNTDAHVSFFAQKFEDINAAFVYGGGDRAATATDVANGFASSVGEIIRSTLKVDTLAVISQTIEDVTMNAAEIVAEAKASMARDLALQVGLTQEVADRIAGDLYLQMQLDDHEIRLSYLEALHVVDKSFSKVIDGPNGTKIVMHFDADGTQRGKARTLTFLENPVVHGEFDILWNDAGEAVNAITGKLVDPMTGLEFDEMAGFSAAAVEDVNVFFGDMFITPKTNTTPFDTAFVAEEVAPVAPFSLDAGTFVLPSSASKVGSK